MTHSVLLKNVRPMSGPVTDMLIVDGRFAEAEVAVPDDIETIDGDNAILIPGLVEAHTHLDKSLLGLPWYRNEVGPLLLDKITNERNSKIALGIDPQVQSERQAILSMAKGSTIFAVMSMWIPCTA